MVPKKVEYIDTLKEYSSKTLKLLWWAIKDKDKRRDLKITMRERNLL